MGGWRNLNRGAGIALGNKASVGEPADMLGGGFEVDGERVGYLDYGEARLSGNEREDFNSAVVGHALRDALKFSRRFHDFWPGRALMPGLGS